MRLIAGLLLAALGLALAWWSGAFQLIAWWAAGQQRDLQAVLAAEIQALRAGGNPAAFWSLMLACAGYGFVHAVGPGHGKLLVAGAAVATRATALRMALIATLGSLGQAAVALAVVYGAFAVLEASARGTVASVDRWIAPAGNAAIAAIGAWLLLRGLRSLRPAGERPRGHAAHAACGHRHGPSADEVARAAGLGPTLALIGGIAARPCTGALVVLVIAWRMELAGVGAAAVAAMGLGTAAFTGLVAVLAVGSRDAAFLTAGDGRARRILAPGLQILAGGLIFAVSGMLAVRGLAA